MSSKGKFDPSVERSLKLAEKFDAKLSKLGQFVQNFPAASGAGVNAPYVPGTEPPVGGQQDATAPILLNKEINAPQVPEKEKAAPAPAAPKAFDPKTVTTLQQFLNNALRDEIIAGNASPLNVNGKMDNFTVAALKQWAKKIKAPGGTVADLMNVALSKSKMASVRDNFVKLAEKFDKKYSR